MHTTTTPPGSATAAPRAALPSTATTAVVHAMARLASLRVWVVAAAGYGIFAALFFASGARFSIPTVQQVCGQPPPDMRFTSTAAEVHGFLEACGPTGREAYRALQVADLLYPLVFAVFLAASLALVLRLIAPGRPTLLSLAALPFVAAAFDYLENAGAWLALAAWPRPGIADGLIGLLSAAKTVTSWAAGALLLVAVAVLAVDRARALAVQRRRGAPLGTGDQA